MKHRGRTVNTVEKALKLLMLLNQEQSQWGVRQLSAQLGFSPATVQRLLGTLKDYDFVAQDPLSRQYRLGNVYFSFFQTLQSRYTIIQTALPVMNQLLTATRETVHLNIIDGLERVTINTLESPRPLKAGMPIGSRAPLYAGASARCLLAFSSTAFRRRYIDTVDLKPFTVRTIRSPKKLARSLALIRRKGYAQSLGERNPGLGSLSAPIFDHQGCVAAAISLAVPEIRFTEPDRRQGYITALLAAGKATSQSTGHPQSAGSPDSKAARQRIR